MDLGKLGDLAALPWQLQLVFVSGYCAYRLSYLGLRDAHKAIDTVFLSLAFGLVTAAVMFVPAPLADWWRATLAFASTLLAGVLWRQLGREGLRAALRATRFSFADDTASAWQRLLENRDYVTQMTVELDTGEILYCTDTAPIGHLPFGPCVLGTNGDLLFYPNRAEAADGTETNVGGGLMDANWGALVTYLPRERIKRLSIRHQRINGPAKAAAE